MCSSILKFTQDKTELCPCPFPATCLVLGEIFPECIKTNAVVQNHSSVEFLCALITERPGINMKSLIVCFAVLAVGYATTPPATSTPTQTDAVTMPTTSYPYDFTCTAANADSYVEIQCWGYKQCINGQPYVHRCTGGQVLERDTMTCVDSGNTDCKVVKDCTKRPDGMYADLGDKCQSYYRCFREENLGHFYCPATLVFNEALQICDYKKNVPLCSS
ncbi:chondroitin proteoglycan 1 isoform X2 [Aplysia californica]|uniref:Chondroitin proteoglycan 1 isoform X2 n=1 Tax=Aplysia californica TaxID=6500 RepID=A0ABM0K0Y1_APLCA|nr:chondroitin proteoglycan 1 isoform X2 [Aplysia californica]